MENGEKSMKPQAAELPPETRRWLNWLRDIPFGSTFVPYPIQLANAIRIMENDAVYLFDEVGSGKTMSAGIMARTYLHMFPNERVLVVTTNTVKTNKQFEEDWARIMPSDLLKRVDVVNNLITSDLKGSKEYGLVIIDEAQEFGNTWTDRRKWLEENLRAKKVVFLTATPLRYSAKWSLQKYVELAGKMLAHAICKGEAKVPPSDWIEKIDSTKLNGTSFEPDQLICGCFDPYSPVTRYFKDTIRYLNIHERKTKARRVIPELWDCREDEKRLDALVRHIQEKHCKNEKSRFIVFANRKAEAQEILNALTKKGLGAERIFAEEKGKLANYGTTDVERLPTVLIVNYQIGEAGVNLPGYDHVVHWYISGDPSRLEQRYGRIDRLTSTHEEIHSCFVMPKDFYDSNYSNFNHAVHFTMGDLLTALPVRNVLLTKEVFDRYRKLQEYRQEDLEELRNFYQELEQHKNELLCAAHVIEREENPQLSGSGLRLGTRSLLLGFLKNAVDAVKEDDEGALDEQTLWEKLDERIRIGIEARSKQLKKDQKDYSEYIKLLEEQSDKIFFLTKENDPTTLTVVGAQDDEEQDGKKLPGCAASIEKSKAFRQLRELIREQFIERRVCALLIIDMINDYAAPDGREGCPNVSAILPNIQRLKAKVRDAGGICVYVNTAYLDENEPEARLWGPSAMRGTTGAEVIETLRPERGDITVQKHAYDGFYETGLDAALRAKGVTDVIVTGVHTHACVLQTALGAFERGYHVIAPKDAMATNRQEVHDTVLPYFSTHLAAELVTTKELIERLGREQNRKQEVR